MIDVYSGYVLTVPLTNENSSTIAEKIENFIIKPFGPPKEISSDNAANLNGPEVQKLLKFYSIKRRLTTPYSPESHGQVENANRYVVEIMRILADQYQCTWNDVMTLALLIVNAIPRPNLSNHSPYYIMFNSEPFLDPEFTADSISVDYYINKSINNKNFC